jgi:hypothetical protein
MKMLHGMLFAFCCLIVLMYPVGIHAECGPIKNWSKDDVIFFNTTDITGVTIYNEPVNSSLCETKNQAVVFYLKLEGKGNTPNWPIRTWIWSYGEAGSMASDDYVCYRAFLEKRGGSREVQNQGQLFLYYDLITTDEDDIDKVDYLELAALYRGCVINLRGGVSFSDRKAFANVWALYKKTLTNARRLIDSKCGGTAPGASLTADPASLIIGTGEMAAIKILGRPPLTSNLNLTWDPSILHPLPYGEGWYLIAGIDEGSEKLTFYHESEDEVVEVEVPVMVVEGAFATLRENEVLYIPYLEYQGNYFQVLLALTSLDPFFFQVIRVAKRDAYWGCSRPAKLKSYWDIEIPCFRFDGSLYTMVLEFQSVNPTEFLLRKARKLEWPADYELCFPQVVEQIKKYRD